MYVGQSKRPVARWRSHLQQWTGSCCFGETLWAILVWDVPPDCLNAAESYMIGFAMAKWQCVNMNRGYDQEAFIIGFQDGLDDGQPQICNSFELSDLTWQNIHPIDPSCGMYSTYMYDEKLWHRRWGFHLRTHDFEKAVSHEVDLRMKPLKEAVDSRHKELREKESKLSSELEKAFCRGIFVGAILVALVLAVYFARTGD